ncbi:MAG: lysylphosphatidylglycerol synthase domain-containing protein [Candidatus Edwardsbacteria bacterium]|nr:lysylphosphatidylglycerol synthase domain-containing protein [Candidatus Edwardsbacteria bacterium]
MKKYAGIVVVLIILFFLGKGLYYHWSEVPFHKLTFNVRFAVLSFGLLIATIYPGVQGWSIIMKAYGCSFGFRRTMWILGTSQLAKYLPGPFWAIGGRAYLYRKEGVPEIKTVLASIIEMGVWLVSAATCFVLSLPFWRGADLPPLAFAGVLLVPIGFVMLHPRFFGSGINFFLRKAKRKERTIAIDYRGILGVVALFFGSWLLQGTGFFCLIKTVYPAFSFQNLVPVIGVYSSAWAVGFLSFITPSGLGVREFTLSYMLQWFMPYPLAIIISILARIWSTLFEMGMAMAAVSIGK